MEILRWQNIAPGAAFHASRVSAYRGPVTYHGHDFAEILWINSGHGVHRINRTSAALETGTLVMMRSTDCHGIEPAGDQVLKLTNIAFPREVTSFLQRRYFADRPGPFSPAGKLPMTRQLDPARLQRFNHWADELSDSPRDSIHLERFLLNVLVDLDGEQIESLPAAAPSWLARACSLIRRPEHFSRGVEEFLRLCGRSREHAARTVRHHFGRTPTEHVNGIRMAYAQRQLEMGDRGILEIALDCGIQNQSHFYQLFRAHTGTTPRQYRRLHRRPLA